MLSYWYYEMAEILVVDDIPDNLKLLAGDVEDAGYEVLTASSGKEALKIVHQEGPEIIITDWMMPEMDGLDLCRAIRSSEGVGIAYIIVLTAYSDMQQLIKAFEAGADDFLAKPYYEQELLARVKAGIRITSLETNLARERRAVFKANAELAVLNDRLHHMATTDELTGLFNRREAMRAMGEQWATSVRSDQPLSCMIFDIDHFKRYNDSYGHDVGDLVLKKTSTTVRKAARLGERVYRIGGEEFLIIMPLTNIDQALLAGERIRSTVEKNNVLVNDTSLTVTISVGVAERVLSVSKPDDLLKKADEALYIAKKTGRNKVCAAPNIDNTQLIESNSIENVTSLTTENK